MEVFKELKNELVEFCSTTSIQGMRNITDSKQGEDLANHLLKLIFENYFIINLFSYKLLIKGTFLHTLFSGLARLSSNTKV